MGAPRKGNVAAVTVNMLAVHEDTSGVAVVDGLTTTGADTEVGWTGLCDRSYYPGSEMSYLATGREAHLGRASAWTTKLEVMLIVRCACNLTRSTPDTHGSLSFPARMFM